MSVEKNTIVTTTDGKVEGSYEDNLYVFRGIPYAVPPIGSLRWMPPQPVKPWDGVRPAREFSRIAPQRQMPAGPIVHEEQPQDEDCLSLNVWTPGLDDARRPVMVWIHGGAFTIGSGSESNYGNGQLPSRGDIVLVTINYRLGMLGFLRLVDVTGGKIPAGGNMGFLDQVVALKWVRENIAAFGGNPDNITVFGESAGAMSVACLMAMPAARGLFNKGILESGAGGTVVAVETANDIAAKLLKILDVKGSDEATLRMLTPQQLLDAELELCRQEALPGEAMRVTVTVPVVDGDVLPEVPNQAIKKGAAKGVAVIVGTNTDEWRLFGSMRPNISQLDHDGMIEALESFLPAEKVPYLTGVYAKSREVRSQSNAPFLLLSAILSDIMFRIPAIELIEGQRDNGTPAYSYLFNWPSPVMGGALGACHALEIGFVFGNYDVMFCGTGPEADKLSRCMQDAWLAFARTGKPGCPSIGEWPFYGQDRLTMMLDRDCYVEKAPLEDERHAWDDWKPEMYPLP